MKKFQIKFSIKFIKFSIKFNSILKLQDTKSNENSFNIPKTNEISLKRKILYTSLHHGKNVAKNDEKLLTVLSKYFPEKREFFFVNLTIYKIEIGIKKVTRQIVLFILLHDAGRI